MPRQALAAPSDGPWCTTCRQMCFGDAPNAMRRACHRYHALAYSNVIQRYVTPFGYCNEHSFDTAYALQIFWRASWRWTVFARKALQLRNACHTQVRLVVRLPIPRELIRNAATWTLSHKTESVPNLHKRVSEPRLIRLAVSAVRFDSGGLVVQPLECCPEMVRSYHDQSRPLANTLWRSSDAMTQRIADCARRAAAEIEHPTIRSAIRARDARA